VAEPPLLVIVGPTGSGKSELALQLAKEFDGEIVNCDSVQLYKFLNIGTAKTPPHERQGIPHHLIDILNPDEHFTAGDYSRAARTVLHEITDRGKLPILVGGTGFYLRALINGLFTSPERNVELRERLARRKPGSLHRLLRRFDPAAASRIHPNDTNKLIRALEICLESRRPMSELFLERLTQPLTGFRVTKIGLNPPRADLAERIDARCVRMFAGGLLDEVRHILSLGYPADAKALLSIGYREAILHLSGRLSYEEAVRQTQAATRQYAKRQRTWFRREPDVWWIQGFGQQEKIVSSTVHHLRVDIKFV
jgi:tRNA dimethylallyltransferase